MGETEGKADGFRDGIREGKIEGLYDIVGWTDGDIVGSREGM